LFYIYIYIYLLNSFTSYIAFLICLGILTFHKMYYNNIFSFSISIKNYISNKNTLYNLFQFKCINSILQLDIKDMLIKKGNLEYCDSDNVLRTDNVKQLT